MRTQTLKRYLAYSLLVASFMLLATSAKAQERRVSPVEIAIPIDKNTCPRPIAMTLTASTPNVVNADFLPGFLAPPPPVAWLNDQASNKKFLYTFQWKQEGRCCEITRAVLTVKMKSNQAGHKPPTSDAGNDGIAILYLGNVVQPYSQPVYGAFPPPLSGSPAPSWPFPVGQPSTKQWIITGTALSNMNASQRLSIYVQDDTTVESATLQISGCCLSMPQRTTTDQTSPVESPN